MPVSVSAELAALNSKHLELATDINDYVPRFLGTRMSNGRDGNGNKAYLDVTEVDSTDSGGRIAALLIASGQNGESYMAVFMPKSDHVQLLLPTNGFTMTKNGHEWTLTFPASSWGIITIFAEPFLIKRMKFVN